MKGTVVIASGGMDSAVLLALSKDQGPVKSLSFDYGQRHKCELKFAERMAKYLQIPHAVADISAVAPLIQGESSQVNPDIPVPEGHYADENMKQTVVPNRNMIMLSIAIGHAISIGYDFVSYGAHAGDHTIYPDCRPEFATAIATAALLCDFEQIKVIRPFIQMGKHDIAALGHGKNIPWELTWSCYKGSGIAHCGKCGTCVERKEAFQLAQLDDPTVYAA